MNWLMPEPASDIRAQIAALQDKNHPKTAVFAAPGNELAYVPGLMRAARREGVLLTADPELLAMFERDDLDDDLMARILGYPESKTKAMAACAEGALRVVQARDWRGDVITEALCSPAWLERTCNALAPHGSFLQADAPARALNRRLAMRAAGDV